MTPEGQLKVDVLEYLALRGEWVIRMNPGQVKVKRGYMHLAPEGTADILIMRAVPYWLELKAKGGHTNPSRREKQKEFRDKVLALGQSKSPSVRRGFGCAAIVWLLSPA